MAIIRNLQTGQELILNCYHTIGRSKVNHLAIPEVDISKTHATISWENGTWFLRDQSRNGTKVNKGVVRQSTQQLSEGAVIQFGGGKSTIWKLITDESPSSYLRTLTETPEFIDLGQGYLYPNEETPEISFYRVKNMTWVSDDGSNIQELGHEEPIQLGGKDWIFYENEPLGETQDNSDITQDAYFQFQLSPDEEEVSVKIILNDLEMDLGERVYNHLLLLLVRGRDRDQSLGVNETEQGWMDVDLLTTALGKELVKSVDVYYINILIHRLRKQLMTLTPYGHMFSNIVERKKGKLRFSHPNFKVVKRT